MIGSFLGLISSGFYDLPTDATIVISFGIILIA